MTITSPMQFQQHVPCRIAVLLATYNGARYIAAFLDSLVAQSCADFVLYVRDDGSTDATLRIIAEYATRLDIVNVASSQRLGPGYSFLALLEAASDDCAYFAFADQDDVWVADKLARARAALLAEPAVPALYFAKVAYVDEQLAPLGVATLAATRNLPSALVENVAMGCTMMINRAARALVLESRPQRLTMHDWWVYLLVMAFGRIQADDFVALHYRQHANNAVGGTASVPREYLRKLAGFFKRSKREVTISQQARELSMHYGARMTAHQKTQVDSLWLAARQPWRRVALALHSPFVRQRRIDTLILRVLFLLGKF